jgi:hypothetical protein
MSLKIQVGDMVIECTTRDYDDKGEVAPKSALGHFLKVAERCYIERHGTKPERTTVEEF